MRQLFGPPLDSTRGARFTCPRCGRAYRKGWFWKWEPVDPVQDIKDMIAEHPLSNKGDDHGQS